MPNEKLKKSKKRLDLTLKPLSPRETQASESVLDRLLGAPEKSTLTQYTGTLNEPVRETNQFVTETGSPDTPVRRDTVVLNKPVRETKGYIEPRHSGYLKIPNEIIDAVITRLTPFEQSVYLRLYRLSHGFGETTCIVGITALTRACNMKETACRAALRRLIDLQLIRPLAVHNSKTAKGTTYEIYTGSLNEPVCETDRFVTETGPSNEPNKDHDDDFKNKDHHQSETMKIYQTLTGNSWTKADQAAYQKIKNVPLEKVEQGIHLANQRAASHPNSLNYFVKEILNLARPSKQSRAQRKKALEKIVARVRELQVGGPHKTVADLTADVKEACVREGVPFDNDLFNKIIGMQ